MFSFNIYVLYVFGFIPRTQMDTITNATPMCVVEKYWKRKSFMTLCTLKLWPSQTIQLQGQEI